MSKVDALSWMPWVMAGVLMTLNGRWLAGSVLTALFFSLQVKASHFQITYYLAFIILFTVLFYLIDAFRNKTLPQVGKNKGPIAALFFGISGHDLQIGTNMRCQVSLIDDQQI